MMAEAKALKTSSSAYKNQIEDLVVTSKRLQPAVAKEEKEEAKAPLLKKGKQPAKSPTMASTATYQTTIPTGVIIRERVAPSPKVALATATSIPIHVVTLAQHLE